MTLESTQGSAPEKPDTSGTGGTGGNATQGTQGTQTGTRQDAGNPAPQNSGTIFEDDDDTGQGDAGKQGATPGEWPDDWRERIAGGDDKYLAELKRYASFDAYTKSQRALRQKLSSGEYKKTAAYPSDGTPEQQAKWREENGLPKAPTDYKPAAIDGHEWTEADKPLLDAFFTKMHAENATQGQVDAALAVYADVLSGAKAQQAEMDKALKLEAEDELRGKFGNDYRGNMNLYKRLLTDAEVFPEGLGEVLATARTADGKRLANLPGVAEFFINIARDRYGDAGMLTGSEAKQLDDEESQARQIMKTDINRYYAEGWDKKLTAAIERKNGSGKRQASVYDE